ncbi:MAG: PIG-L family deacetylase [Gemmatimonadetes bacterium]|nr:PIG-L family deacetylase [Gemmatimonadota bacterium]
MPDLPLNPLDSVRSRILTHRRLAAAAFCVIVASQTASAQLIGAAELDQAVRGLTVTARVLVIAAHPDDEDTQTIAYLARGKHVETAYLSLTRGDGGQNLIGNELGESLGAIRTEELLAARRVDGGRQYFTRAYDFGFSKNADETANHWPRDSILGDAVTVIRAFRPHVIYSVWSGTPADGHGHHETAGIVAREAFEAAGDTVRFPAFRYGEPWEPLKFYRRGPGVSLDVNAYDPVLGRTFAAIAAESRSQHRSQGFAGVALRSIVPGAAGGRGGRGGPFGGGSLMRVATRVNGNVAPADERSIFDGIDTSFNRLVLAAPEQLRVDLAGAAIKADSAVAALDFREPWRLAPVIARLTAAVQHVRSQVPACVLRNQRTPPRTQVAGMPATCNQAELDLDASLSTIERRAGRALLASTGINIEAIAPTELLAFGDSVPVTITMVNHGRDAVTVRDVRATGGPRTGFHEFTLKPDSGAAVTQTVIGYPDLRSWWLGGTREALFEYRRSPADGIARVSANSADLVSAVAISEEERRMSEVRVTLEVAGVSAVVNAGPLVYRTADPLLGVQDRPLGGVPPVTLEFDRNLEWMPAGKPIDRMLRLTVKSFSDSEQTFALVVVAPRELRVDSVPPSVTLGPRERREIFVRLRGSLKSGRYEFGAVGQFESGAKFAEGFSSIIYPHIRPIYRYRTSGVYLQAVDVTVPQRLTVAYVQGVGDDNAVYLRQLGVPVTVIDPATIAQWDLSRFTTVVIGTRAFDASSDLVAYAPRLMDYAKNGGTLVLQYGQTFNSIPALFPFPMSWQQRAERVTVEEAPVTVLKPTSKLLTTPNRIGDDDWKDWVQERSLYMPSAIDPRYETPIEMHDPDENENKGALVMAPVGKGMFVFTSLSLFRQLPGAVPGSARLFVNLLSAGVSPTVRLTP